MVGCFKAFIFREQPINLILVRKVISQMETLNRASLIIFKFFKDWLCSRNSRNINASKITRYMVNPLQRHEHVHFREILIISLE